MRRDHASATGTAHACCCEVVIILLSAVLLPFGYWWYVTVPEARINLAKDKRLQGGETKAYLDELASSDEDRPVERWRRLPPLTMTILLYAYSLSSTLKRATITMCYCARPS